MDKVTEKEYRQAKKIVDKYREQERKREIEDLNSAMPEIRKLLVNYLPLSAKREGDRFFIILCNCEAISAPIDLADELEKIGKKHDLKLKFPYWYYPK